MPSSILTNPGAMTALANLQSTQKNLLQTQNRISTGLKVATAKDNAATWAISSAMKSDISNMKQVGENLSLSSSIVGTARNASETISGLVSQIRSKVTSAQNSAVDKAQVQADIDQLVSQISGVVDAAQFKGVNLINAAGNERVLASVNNVGGSSTPAFIDVGKLNMKVEGGELADLKTVDVTSRGDHVFGNATAAEGRMGTRTATFDAPGTLAAGTFTVNYTNSAGDAKTLSVTYTDASATMDEMVSALNADSNFSAVMFASKDGSGALVLQAASRDVEVGDFKIDSVSGNGYAAGYVADKVSVSATFKAEPLKEGEVFSLSYDLTGTTKTIKLQVADATSGTSLGQDADGNQIYAINKNVVSDSSATATQIADEIEAAALGSSDFAAAAAAGTKVGVTAAAGVLTITTADETDNIVAFKAPETDYSTLLSTLDSLSATVDNAATAFGSAQSRIEIQKDFVGKLVDTLTEGVGALVDADMAEEAARLQALQVQEQLGTQALSIANQAPQSILSLFR